MCGIIGYSGRHQAAPLLLKGLKSLEYRGYDSAGMITLTGKFNLKKDIGKVDAINEKLNFLELPGELGIAHTRWATHGEVTKENAHPHTSNNGKISVVHNGIIENYQGLRQFLQQHGFNFLGNTDSEIIPNLIEFEMRSGKSFNNATIDALRKLSGNYAVVILNLDEKKMIAARKGSPLVVGLSDEGAFASSDIPAFIETTKNVMYLYDSDVVFFDNSVRVFNIQENRFVQRNINSVEWDVEQAQKGDFDHFMIKEVSEQVDTVKRATMQDRSIFDKITQEIKNSKGVFLVGAGSSFHACLSASYIFSKVSNLHVNVVLASEFPYYEHFLNENSLIIAVSQSGETTDVLEAVKTARKKGSKVISIVNVMGSSLTQQSHNFLLLNAGPEIGVLSSVPLPSQLDIEDHDRLQKYDFCPSTFLLNILYYFSCSQK